MYLSKCYVQVWIVSSSLATGWQHTLTLFLIAVSHLGLPVAGLFNDIEGQTGGALNFFQTRLCTSRK